MSEFRCESIEIDDPKHQRDANKISEAEALVLAYGQSASNLAYRRGRPSCIQALEATRASEVSDVVTVCGGVVKDAAPLGDRLLRRGRGLYRNKIKKGGVTADR